MLDLDQQTLLGLKLKKQPHALMDFVIWTAGETSIVLGYDNSVTSGRQKEILISMP